MYYKNIDVTSLAGIVEGAPVLLAKPQTYMNLSGESVSTHTFENCSNFFL